MPAPVEPGGRRSAGRIGPLLLALACLRPGVEVRADELPVSRPAAENDEREIRRLREELRAIGTKERSVLEELRRLEAELRLRKAELRDASERIDRLSATIEDRSAGLRRIETEQGDRRRYLAFRLREMYKRGRAAPLRVLVGDEGAVEALRGARYAAVLNERDARTIGAYRGDAVRLAGDREALLAERTRLDAARAEMEEARASLDRARAEQASYLAEIRRDRRKSEEALRELQSAAGELGGIAVQVGEPPAERADPTDAASLRGRLEWPVAGKVTAKFGNVVHPQFKTVVPHPGLDLEAPEGSTFRAVHDGKVVYSAALRGYGLTVLVDHGDGLISVYAHAAALVVEAGETVAGGQALGTIGDTGSLRGPFLYFELRRNGKPIDPLPWLRRR